MIYAQFYHYDLGGNLAEACGDRSVVIIDARLSNTTVGKIAEEECRKRGYEAWAVFRGESLMNGGRVSEIWCVNPQEPVREPSWLSAHGM